MEAPSLVGLLFLCDSLILSSNLQHTPLPHDEVPLSDLQYGYDPVQVMGMICRVWAQVMGMMRRV